MSNGPVPTGGSVEPASTLDRPAPRVITRGARLSIGPAPSHEVTAGTGLVDLAPSQLASSGAGHEAAPGEHVPVIQLEAPPATVTIDDVTMVSDRHAVLFVRPGDDRGRALRWEAIRSVTISRLPPSDASARTDAPSAGLDTTPGSASDTVEVVLDSWRHRYVVKLVGPDRSAEQLLWALSAITPPWSLADDLTSVDILRPPAQPHPSAPSSNFAPERPTAPRASPSDDPVATRLAPDLSGPPLLPISGVLPASIPTADSKPAPASTVIGGREAQASWFDQLRPLLTVALVVVVATMAALVLAASVGAIHLSWLGSNGAGAPGAALVTNR